MVNRYRSRRSKLIFIVIIICCIGFYLLASSLSTPIKNTNNITRDDNQLALVALRQLEIKGRASKTGYSRDKFGSGWSTKLGCNTRNIILNRDMSDKILDDECNIIAGKLDDPYSGETIVYNKNTKDSPVIDIDHVVALSDAWQKGAQALSYDVRVSLANDPLELLAVSSKANVQKGDSDAASWLPSNKAFHCQYIARQIAVKLKYQLWVTLAEFNTMSKVLYKCPEQLLPKA